MRNVYLAQCLCPQRHAILATAGLASDQAQAERILVQPLVMATGKMIEQKQINPWCGLCGATSKHWKYEVGRTPYRTMEEAMPHLRKLEEENRHAAQQWHAAARATNN